MKSQAAATFSCLSVCPTNNYPDIDTCKPCHSTCSTCQGGLTTQCTSCSGLLLESEINTTFSCVVSCAPQKYNDAGKCRSCHSSCFSCDGIGSNNCLTCNANNFWYASSCSVTQPSNTYCTIDSSQGFNYSRCNPCHASCSSCSNSASCATCPSTHTLLVPNPSQTTDYCYPICASNQFRDANLVC